jgi:octaprenyl-diphosphate synthase
VQTIAIQNKPQYFDELAELERLFPQLIPTETALSRSVVEHIFAGGGKRIRPQLFLLICDLVSYKGPHRLPMAAVCELIHAASLLHDDVVDNSPTRRGRASSHVLWGDVTAILVGDLIYARASELMAATGNMNIVTLFARVIRQMSEAEILQLDNLFNPDMRIEDYHRIVQGKTASLISAACVCPGLLAGCTEQQVSALRIFGGNIGTVFQLIDDMLDYTGDEKAMGKIAKADLLEGKVTHPIHLLRDLASPQDKPLLLTAIKDPNAERLELVQAMVQKYQATQETLRYAEELSAAALVQLDYFDNSEVKDTLKSLVQLLLARAN